MLRKQQGFFQIWLSLLNSCRPGKGLHPQKLAPGQIAIVGDQLAERRVGNNDPHAAVDRRRGRGTRAHHGTGEADQILWNHHRA